MRVLANFSQPARAWLWLGEFAVPLTRSVFALVGHRNLYQPTLPTTSLSGTNRLIFILYKVNHHFILIHTFLRLSGARLHSSAGLGDLCTLHLKGDLVTRHTGSTQARLNQRAQPTPAPTSQCKVIYNAINDSKYLHILF